MATDHTQAHSVSTANQEAEVPIDGPNEWTSKTFKNLFADSTHQFLYAAELAEDGRNIHLGDKVIAILVLVAQCGLYLFLFQAARLSYASDEVAVAMAHGACIDKDFGNLMCSAEDISLGTMSTSLIMFLCFMAPDIGGALSLILTGSQMAKVTGVLLLVEVFLATLCCTMMAFVGGLSSAADAILAAVGVAFIHDLDEKVRSVYTSVPKFKHLIILIVLTLGIGAICLVVQTMILSAGQDYDSDTDSDWDS